MVGVVMSNNIMLMCGDTEVLEFNFSTDIYNVKCERLLPFGLKGKIVTTVRPTIPDMKLFDKYNSDIRTNYNAVVSWLASRTLLLSRYNAKKIYNAIGFNQEDTPENKARISITCRSVSILDNYWLRLDGDTSTWQSINVRHNSLNETVAQVALHGSSISIQGSLTTPELTTDGVYPKAWRRYPDNTLWLHKADHIIEGKAMIEVMCSNILDKMNVQHCHYEIGTDGGKQVCKCKALTDDKHSIVPALDYLKYCKANNIDFIKSIMDIDKDAIYKMCIVDYLIANNDRHSRNWGFLYKPSTMELIGCHPLFDHNNSFDPKWLANRNAEYRFNGKSMRDTAKSAMEEIDFHFTYSITRDDFLTDEQYEEFMWRANDLGIQVKRTYDDEILSILNKYIIPLHVKEVKSLLPTVELPYVELEEIVKNIYTL